MPDNQLEIDFYFKKFFFGVFDLLNDWGFELGLPLFHKDHAVIIYAFIDFMTYEKLVFDRRKVVYLMKYNFFFWV